MNALLPFIVKKGGKKKKKEKKKKAMVAKGYKIVYLCIVSVVRLIGACKNNEIIRASNWPASFLFKEKGGRGWEGGGRTSLAWIL